MGTRRTDKAAAGRRLPMVAPGLKGRRGELNASDLRVGLIVSRYNEEISNRLLRGALSALRAMQAPKPELYWVPGALEIPVVAMNLAESGTVDAIVALGCVIKGETAHFEIVAHQCAAGLIQVAVDTGIPCAFGVLTTYTLEQALARSGDEDNKGAEAAETAVEVANLIRQVGQ